MREVESRIISGQPAGRLHLHDPQLGNFLFGTFNPVPAARTALAAASNKPPIISQPNVAILRIGEIKKRPVVVTVDGEDHIAIHPVMYTALSYDHRIIDGVEANSFLWRVSDILNKAEVEL